jgi:rRNA maturation endonuclease Nob1
VTPARTADLRCVECERKFPNMRIPPRGVASMYCPDCGAQSLLPDVWGDRPAEAAS